jgi:hypothetical protein
MPEGMSETEMSPMEFIEALVRISMDVRVIPPSKVSGGISTKFEALLQRIVLPNATQSDIGSFLLLVNSSPVQEVLTTYCMAIATLFSYYSRQQGIEGSMTVDHWISFIRDADVMSGTGLTENSCRIIFAMVQMDSRPNMSHSEFVLGLAVLSCFTHPAPWISLRHRIHLLLSLRILPVLRTKVLVIDSEGATTQLGSNIGHWDEPVDPSVLNRIVTNWDAHGPLICPTTAREKSHSTSQQDNRSVVRRRKSRLRSSGAVHMSVARRVTISNVDSSHPANHRKSVM